MENIRLEYEVTRLRGDVVFVGAAIVGALLLNAFILVQISNDIHCLKQLEKEKLKSRIPPDEGEGTLMATDKVQQEQPAKEQPIKETKAESEIKTENEKQ